MQRAKTFVKSKTRKCWQVQTAKAQFSELFRRARTEGPQWVTKHGGEAVVVLAGEEYERLQGCSRPKQKLVEFLLNSPLRGSGVEFERVADYGRDVDL